MRKFSKNDDICKVSTWFKREASARYMTSVWISATRRRREYDQEKTGA